MPLRVSCPDCDTQHNLAPELAGKRIRCKNDYMRLALLIGGAGAVVVLIAVLFIGALGGKKEETKPEQAAKAPPAGMPREGARDGREPDVPRKVVDVPAPSGPLPAAIEP